MVYLLFDISAKFLKLEQLDQDVDASEMIGVSVDGTGQVGTYFYTAPEIEQMWPKINEKVRIFYFQQVLLDLDKKPAWILVCF